MTLLSHKQSSLEHNIIDSQLETTMVKGKLHVMNSDSAEEMHDKTEGSSNSRNNVSSSSKGSSKKKSKRGAPTSFVPGGDQSQPQSLLESCVRASNLEGVSILLDADHPPDVNKLGCSGMYLIERSSSRRS